jgi:hypothetical protein
MTIQTQKLHPLLKWVKFLFCKLSTIAYDLFLQNKVTLSCIEGSSRPQSFVTPDTDPGRNPGRLCWTIKNAKQTQFSTFSAQKKGLPKKQTQKIERSEIR